MSKGSLRVSSKGLELGLVGGVEPHPKDSEIIKALTAAKRKLGGSTDSVIAFKNLDDKVYRRAVLNGVHQEMYLAERLELHGLVDESEHGGRRPKGVWACFGPKRDMTLEGVLEQIKTGVRPLANPQ
jgi:hypothetical protein